MISDYLFLLKQDHGGTREQRKLNPLPLSLYSSTVDQRSTPSLKRSPLAIFGGLSEAGHSGPASLCQATSPSPSAPSRKKTPTALIPAPAFITRSSGSSAPSSLRSHYGCASSTKAPFGRLELLSSVAQARSTGATHLNCPEQLLGG